MMDAAQRLFPDRATTTLALVQTGPDVVPIFVTPLVGTALDRGHAPLARSPEAGVTGSSPVPPMIVFPGFAQPEAYHLARARLTLTSPQIHRGADCRRSPPAEDSSFAAWARATGWRRPRAAWISRSRLDDAQRVGDPVERRFVLRFGD